MAQFVHFGYRRIQKGLIAFFALTLLAVLISPLWVNKRVAYVASAATADTSARVAGANGRASAAVVMECETGRVLYHDNAMQALPMASTTKILTAITVLHHVDVSRVVTVDDRAVGIEGSSIYLQKGERWRVLDLLYGLMLRSGNDAAVQLALITAGSVEAFAALMNDEAMTAGAYRSHFVNPHGLHDPAHYTTAYDLARITAYALRDYTFRAICSCRQYTFRMQDGTARTFANKNKMLAGYPGAIGVKTGYTKVAGRCLVTAAEREGMRLVSVVLNEYDMWYRSAALLDATFATYSMRSVWPAGEARTMRMGKTIAPVTVRQDSRYPLSEDEWTHLRYAYVPTEHRASDGALGEVEVRFGERILTRAPLYATW